MELSFLKTLAIAAIPALITAWITLYLSRKSDIKENTKKLEELIGMIGNCDEETLRNLIGRMQLDIGRGSGETLTRQHLAIKNDIRDGFDMIKKRYEEEDSDFRHLTLQQYDIKKTIDGFSRDYLEQIKQVETLKVENDSLRQEVEELKVKIQYYKQMQYDELDYGEPEL